MELAELLDKCKKFNVHFQWSFDAWKHDFFIDVTVNKKTYRLIVYPKNKNIFADNEDYDWTSHFNKVGPFKRNIEYKDIDKNSECFERFKLVGDRWVKEKHYPLEGIFRTLELKDVIAKIPKFQMVRKGYKKLFEYLNKFHKESISQLIEYWKSYRLIHFLKLINANFEKKEDVYLDLSSKHKFNLPDPKEDPQYYKALIDFESASLDKGIVQKLVDIKKIKRHVGVESYYEALHEMTDFDYIEHRREFNIQWLKKFLDRDLEPLFDKLVSEVETSLKAEMQLTECEFLKK